MDFIYNFILFFWTCGEANILPTTKKKNLIIDKNKKLLMEKSMQQRLILDHMKIQIKLKTIFGR